MKSCSSPATMKTEWVTDKDKISINACVSPNSNEKTKEVQIRRKTNARVINETIKWIKTSLLTFAYSAERH